MKLRNTMTLLALGLAAAMASGCGPQQKDGDKTATASAAPVSSDVLLNNVRPIIEKASGGSFTAKSTFPGPENSGLVGVILAPAQGVGAKQVGWASADGSVITPGPLFDKNGTNLNETALAEHGGLLQPKDLAQRILDSNLGFVAGKSGPIVTVFFEPYCGYCNKLFEELRPKIDNGTLRARFVMVSFLRPDSAARAADIMTAKDSYKALKAWEGLADKMNAPASKATTEQQQPVLQASAMFNEASLGGTPATLICNKTSNKLEVVRGYPADTSAFFASIGDEGHEICTKAK